MSSPVGGFDVEEFDDLLNLAIVLESIEDDHDKHLTH